MWGEFPLPMSELVTGNRIVSYPFQTHADAFGRKPNELAALVGGTSTTQRQMRASFLELRLAVSHHFYRGKKARVEYLKPCSPLGQRTR